MRYYNKNINSDIVIQKLSKKIIDGITSTLTDYAFLYTEEELKKIISYRNDLEIIKDLEPISYIEDTLKPLIFRTWDYENSKGNDFIHWLKKDKFNKNKKAISSTFGNTDSFCDSVIGVRYAVNLDSFLGACEKDAATLIESSDKKSIYTIGELPNGEVINSYNLATPIITPKQVFSNNKNDYMSKHNEIILDGRYAIPTEIICINDDYNNVANEISIESGIPFNNTKMK